jgi:hypothetical protein
LQRSFVKLIRTAFLATFVGLDVGVHERHPRRSYRMASLNLQRASGGGGGGGGGGGDAGAAAAVEEAPEEEEVDMGGGNLFGGDEEGGGDY